MLKEVRETSLAVRFLLGSHVVPDADRYHRSFAVGVDEDPQTIGESELIVINIEGVCEPFR